MNFWSAARGFEGGMRVSFLPLISLFSSIYKFLIGKVSGRSCGGLHLAVAGAFLLFFLPASGRAQVSTQTPAGGDEWRGEDLISRVIANQKKLDAQLDVFERIEKTELRKTADATQTPEVKVWRVFPAGTGTDKIVLSPEGKPISAESYRADLEKLEKQLIWAAQQGSAQREAYAKLEKRRKERNDLIDTTRQAFVFTKLGEEARGAEMLAKYSMKPNPSYKATTRNAMLFTRVEGTIWIDEKSSQLARIEGHVTEDIVLALFLAKVYKGSYFMQERYELEPGVWLPTFQQYDFDGRKFVVPFSIHERTFFTNYKRVGRPAEAAAVVRDELDKKKSERADP